MEADLKTQILKREEEYWDAMKSNDVEAAVSLTQFPCLVLGPQGVRSVSEDAYRSMMRKTDGSRFKDVSLIDPQVQELTEDTVVIVYSLDSKGGKMIDTSVWTRTDGSWRCGFHSEFPTKGGLA